MMNNILPVDSLALWGLIVFFILVFRYFILAIPPYLIYFVFFRDRFRRNRIAEKLPSQKMIYREIIASILSLSILAVFSTLVVFMAENQWNQLYFNIDEFGLWYLIVSIPTLLVIHDAYFYFGHRLMHTALFYSWTHKLHHSFIRPSPFASFAFQPGEAVVHGLFGVLVFLIFPVHPLAFVVFIILMNIMNVVGHLGHEIFPRGFSRGAGGYIMNTPTHHSMHHLYFRCNYGLYFNWWDRLFRTNHPEYHETFDRYAIFPDNMKARVSEVT